ncbi:BQ5605_C029g10654 [Microbotryum silenes-dioicae]|uniref:BQ5605_C029g10654 protein n=1 Tax=Microbotryum silenes-dioicae TaxID=796604 RepID=A0A2X0PD92_9BASI|nr:BQ5605_C029g10654 [Microbotryum silenes-dioicae]
MQMDLGQKSSMIHEENYTLFYSKSFGRSPVESIDDLRCASTMSSAGTLIVRPSTSLTTSTIPSFVMCADRAMPWPKGSSADVAKSA